MCVCFCVLIILRLFVRSAAPKNAGIAFANLELLLLGDAGLRRAIHDSLDGGDSTLFDRTLDALFRRINLAIGSVRVAQVPVTLPLSTGATLELNIGDVVGVVRWRSIVDVDNKKPRISRISWQRTKRCGGRARQLNAPPLVTLALNLSRRSPSLAGRIDVPELHWLATR